jgi:hypothetical protein
MKKRGLFKIVSAVLMSAFLVAGCTSTKGTGSVSSDSTSANSESSSSDKGSSAKIDSDKKKLSVVCTIFPEYDWVKEIIAGKEDKYEVTMLLDKGTDLHSYQPTADDIAKISACDLFIYVGGESDGWVDDALKESSNPNMQVINLMEVMGDSAKEEEVKEGMQAEEEHDHDHDGEAAEHDHDHDKEANHDHDHDHDNTDEAEIEYDEHVWLSLRNTKKLVAEIEKAVEKIDAENKQVYEENTSKYLSKLDELDKEYEKAVAEAKRKTVLFGDRFPFRYMVDDYGLDYYAAFVGCSAETEASFNTVVFLANKVDELNLPAVLTIEKSDQKIAKTIIENTKEKNQKIEVMNSLQSVTGDEAKNGTSYYSVMKDNLEVLKKALN